MGMPFTIEIAKSEISPEIFEKAFAFLRQVDERFSTYKEDSEISKINRGEIGEDAYSLEMQEILVLAESTRKATSGFFDVHRADGTIDPSGVVKGWAIKHVGDMLFKYGYEHFMIDGAGDIATYGKSDDGKEWSIGIRSPFNREEIVKVVYPRGKGIATSGSAVRGAHIYNPHAPGIPLNEIVSVSVIASDVLVADLYATAAFAMGREGIGFLERQPSLEGYAIDRNGIATMTSGFSTYTTV